MYRNRMNILAVLISVLMIEVDQIIFLEALAVDNTMKEKRTSAPIIELLLDEEELPLGVTWNISCKSNEPIVWKPYDASFDWTPPNVSSIDFLTGEVEMQYGAVLVITNASAASVGRYYCVTSDKKDEDLEEMVTEQFACSVYVFVKDVKQPLVPTPGLVYYIQNEEAFAPCKPSYRDAEVELCNKVGQCLVTLNDPTKGFRLSKTSLNISEDGMMYCKSDNISQPIHLIPSEIALPGIKQDEDEPLFESVEIQSDTSCCLTMIVIALFGFVILWAIYYRDKLIRIGVATRTMFRPSINYVQAPTV